MEKFTKLNENKKREDFFEDEYLSYSRDTLIDVLVSLSNKNLTHEYFSEMEDDDVLKMYKSEKIAPKLERANKQLIKLEGLKDFLEQRLDNEQKPILFIAELFELGFDIKVKN